MDYSVRFREVSTDHWHDIDGVIADGFLDDHAIRYFILSDNTRVEISVSRMIFQFSPGRQKVIAANIRSSKSTDKG